MSKYPVPLLSAITLCAALFGASAAQAAPVNCQTFLAPFVSWANGYNHVEATITSNQANGIASASVGGSGIWGGYFDGKTKMKNAGSYLTNAMSDWRVAPGKWLFSDRVNGSQPFPVNAYESINLYIANDGSWMYINVPSWGSWILVQPPICDDAGVIYGFGSAIGSGTRALYTVSLQQEYDIN